MMTDYDYNPNKKPAPPAFNSKVNSAILNSAKQLVNEANPGQPDIANKLFNDLEISCLDFILIEYPNFEITV